MNRTISFSLILSSFAFNALASTKIIYGVDDRKEVFDNNNSIVEQSILKATAAMIPNSNLIKNGSNYTTTGKTLRERGFCKNEKFVNQVTAANWSGFFIAPDMIVTAGHCVKSTSDCQKSKWVFGYHMQSEDKQKTIPAQNVYSCKVLVNQDLSSGTQNDFALIKLDRSPNIQTKLMLRQKGSTISQGARLSVIGNPIGLPTKITSNGMVRENDNSVFFKTNLDTFGGNSGSVVFDSDTGLVEGILVRGDVDFANSTEQETRIVDGEEVTETVACKASNVVGENEGKGEAVTRITNIPELFYSEEDKSFILAVRRGDINLAINLLNNGADINTRNLDDSGKTALHYAVESSNSDLIAKLVDRGINTEIKNYQTDTAILVASRKGDVDTVKFLAKNGANINYRNSSNHNVVRFAIDRRTLHEVRQVVSWGAKPSVGFFSWLFGLSDRAYAKRVRKTAKRERDSKGVEQLNLIVDELKRFKSL